MSSSLRNSLHRRQHKERSQLAHRTRLGFLEKHKDYVLRARDYHSKQDRLQRLRQKAAERNKDEFYWGMIRGKTQGGVHVQDRGNVALPVDIVKVLKTQDENYIRTMRTAGLKKIDKLRNQLSVLADLVKPGHPGGQLNDDDELDEDEVNILVEAGIIPPSKMSRKDKASSNHVVFVDSQEEAQRYSDGKRSTNDDHSQGQPQHTGADDLGWKPAEKSKKRRKRTSQTETEDAEMTDVGKELDAEAREYRSRLLKELSARLSRDRMLRYAERELEMQRLLMAKGGARKIRGLEKVEGDDRDESEDDEPKRGRKPVDEKAYKPRVYKWRLERKR
ncbi:small-subunit processome [Gloeophyllum trabeum ATCC 11539]|uniref:Small-subunit processome n=1 Tax=Gloeophyllum trabeum (strain ATCC 11539 / FP-39264 / Madison 617) TaxID=670483 RepID=S7QLQ7_GLOTA|nr:small-subunit processome [Gloeophyllum trabeum ATCC 11539]EPQ60368.1 small-subunit processome [Gloeophyllum trabeum ATCC 11539]